MRARALLGRPHRPRSAALTAVLLAAGAVAGLAAAPAATAATPAVLAVDVPLAARAGQAVVYFGSLQVQVGDSYTCLSAGDDVTGGNGRIRFTTGFEVTPGTSYGVSAWESKKCDAYIPDWGRNTRSLGGVTVTPTAADVSSGVWRVTIP